MNMEEESFLVRTTGGPFDGETRVVPLSVLGGWPPPLQLSGLSTGGQYERRNYSQLPNGVADGKYLMRGVDYEWQEAS